MDMSIFNQIKTFAQNRCLPIIPICAKDVSLINDPSSFYKTMIEKIASSRNRLAFSALYLGTGIKEAALVDRISDKLDKEPNLKIRFALDAHRATRADSDGKSSITALKHLLTQDVARLSLVKTHPQNSTLDFLFRKFQKWNELSSTYHSKFQVFDNEVMITGANLSNIYFENRQDRYMLIRNSKLLSDYLVDLVDAFDQDDCEKINEQIHRLNEQFVYDRTSDLTNHDSFVIPLVQLGSSGLTDKEDFLIFLNSILPEEAQVYLSSGYFNPSQAISSIKITSILGPSEKANGFYMGGGMLRYIPRLYSVLHQKYQSEHPQCSIFYYDKPNWSFHAKGVWYTGMDDLYIHIIGSSNYNCRSSVRDLETQLILITKNKDLQQKLELERQRLWNESRKREPLEPYNPLYRLMAKALKSFL